MRRFWLSLLLMVLPLQMSWAAIHYCNDGLATGNAAVVTATQPSDAAAVIVTADEQRRDGALGFEGPCACPCHGVHELPPYPAVRVPGAVTSNAFDAAEQPLHSVPFASRHDRPQWVAA